MIRKLLSFVNRRRIIQGLVVLFCLCTVAGGIGYTHNVSVPVSAKPEMRSEIIIDAGHGGVDSGALGLYGIVEKDINLSISLKLADMLDAMGFKTTLVRGKDESIHDPDANTIRKKKNTDLKNRLNLMNKNPSSITVSIHQNIFEESKYSGAQMFYGTENPESETLAEGLQYNFRKYLQPENSRVIKKAGSNLYLMQNVLSPAVLCECGFLSNPEEAHKLADSDYQDMVAFTIAVSLVEFIQIN